MFFTFLIPTLLLGFTVAGCLAFSIFQNGAAKLSVVAGMTFVYIYGSIWFFSDTDKADQVKSTAPSLIKLMSRENRQDGSV